MLYYMVQLKVSYSNKYKLINVVLNKVTYHNSVYSCVPLSKIIIKNNLIFYNISFI